MKLHKEQDIKRLVSEIKDYQLTHGSLLKLVWLEESSTVPAQPVGVSILPTAFPRSHYEKALKLQICFNQLYMRAACDEKWLYNVLAPLMDHDSLLASLWRIFSQVSRDGFT